MNTIDKSNPLGKNITQFSQALYVLSQHELIRKNEIQILRSELQDGFDDQNEHEAKADSLARLEKKHRYFHIERTEILRYLLLKNIIGYNGYVIKDGLNFALIRIAKYKFYLIINKNMTANVPCIGTELTCGDVLSVEELNAIMPHKEAVKVFNLFLAKVRLKTSKKKTIHSPATLAPAVSNAVLSRTIGSNGTVVVTKKRRFVKSDH